MIETYGSPMSQEIVHILHWCYVHDWRLAPNVDIDFLIQRKMNCQKHTPDW